MKELRIMIVDDHVFVRMGIKVLIEAESDMQVVAEAANGMEALAAAAAVAPDVAVLDVSMPELGGAETAQRLRAVSPATRVLALTMHEDRGNIAELLAAGATGYLLKRAAALELIAAIRSVAQGGLYLDPRIAGKIVETRASEHLAMRGDLSERETSVLQLVARGFSHKEIADQLTISLKTVETNKVRAMTKLGLGSRVDVIQHGVEAGWLKA